MKSGFLCVPTPPPLSHPIPTPSQQQQQQELVTDADSQAPPRPAESETLEMRPGHLCWARCTRQFCCAQIPGPLAQGWGYGSRVSLPGHLSHCAAFGRHPSRPQFLHW